MPISIGGLPDSTPPPEVILTRHRCTCDQTGDCGSLSVHETDKLQAVFSTKARSDEGRPEPTHYVWSPHDAFAGAATLMRLLAEQLPDRTSE
jgi:hypothetical protein